MHIVYLCSIQVVFSVIQVSFERFKSSCNQIWVKDATGITLFVNEFKGRTPRSKLDKKGGNWYDLKSWKSNYDH